MEFTSPDALKMNGVVEQRTATLKQRSQAMLTRAQLTPGIKRLLWGGAMRCANTLYNISATKKSSVLSFELFTGRKSKLYDHLIPFGRIGYITLSTTFHTKWRDRVVRGIMVGYCKNKPKTLTKYSEKTHKR